MTISDHAFEGYASLQVLKIGAGVTIGDHAFSYCASLQDLEIGLVR